MPSKKVIVGLLGIFLAVSIVALIPVFMYGFTVNVTEIETTLGLSSSESLSTSSSIQTQQIPSYDLSNFEVVANEKAMSAYEYFFSRLDGNGEVTADGNGGTEGGAVVDILFTFNLTTPSNNSFSFSFNPLGLNDGEDITITYLFGPDEKKGEVGTFHLIITISITVTPPVNPPAPAIDPISIELTPVNMTFEVTAPA